MEIQGKVHCFFEQSGTFKNEFDKLGIAALDYDISNDFGKPIFSWICFQKLKPPLTISPAFLMRYCPKI